MNGRQPADGANSTLKRQLASVTARRRAMNSACEHTRRSSLMESVPSGTHTKQVAKRQSYGTTHTAVLARHGCSIFNDGGNLTNALLSFQSIKTLLAALVHDLLHDIRYEPKAFTPKKMATGAREGLCVRCSASAGT